MSSSAPTSVSILSSLTQPRILDLARLFGVRLRGEGATKQKLASVLGAQLEGRTPLILRERLTGWRTAAVRICVWNP